MSERSAFTVRHADWSGDGPALQAVRRAVFIVEQRVPEALEWDAADPVSIHALALAGDGQPVGCGRLLQDGHIGRLAVLAAWRGRGVGDALLTFLMALARSRGDACIVLNAQVQAMPFYARHGYVAEGEPFDEAGIPHRVMALTLPPR